MTTRASFVSLCTVFLSCSDYGYMRSSGTSGLCIRDNSVALPHAVCSADQQGYFQSQGYRKIAGDMCVGGEEAALGPVVKSCCAINGVLMCRGGGL